MTNLHTGTIFSPFIILKLDVKPKTNKQYKHRIYIHLIWYFIRLLFIIYWLPYPVDITHGLNCSYSKLHVTWREKAYLSITFVKIVFCNYFRLVQNIIGRRGFKFIQMKDPALFQGGDNSEIDLITVHSEKQNRNSYRYFTYLRIASK